MTEASINWYSPVVVTFYQQLLDALDGDLAEPGREDLRECVQRILVYNPSPIQIQNDRALRLLDWMSQLPNWRNERGSDPVIFQLRSNL